MTSDASFLSTLRAKRFNLADYLLEEVVDLYNCTPAMLEPLLPPIVYGLHDYEERDIEWAPGKQMCLWQRIVGRDKPTYVVFHGINGHWGGSLAATETGAPVTLPNRINWLKAFPADANIIAVSMPGFGLSDGPPSRPNFDAANKALADYLFDTIKLSNHRMVAAGESMGANHAFNFAATACKKGKSLAQVTAVTPFKSMAMAAADVTDLGGWVNLAGKRVLSRLLFGLSNHNHENDKEIERLNGSNTRIVIVSAGMDNVCRPWHQRALAAKAAEIGLPVAVQPHDLAGHKEWDPKAVTAASQSMLKHVNEADAIAEIWALGMNAGVPPLSDQSPLQSRGVRHRAESKER